MHAMLEAAVWTALRYNNNTLNRITENYKLFMCYWQFTLLLKGKQIHLNILCVDSWKATIDSLSFLYLGLPYSAFCTKYCYSKDVFEALQKEVGCK